jgi:hypothetical protein
MYLGPLETVKEHKTLCQLPTRHLVFHPHPPEASLAAALVAMDRMAVIHRTNSNILRDHVSPSCYLTSELFKDVMNDLDDKLFKLC